MAILRRVHGAATAWTTSQALPYSASATTGDRCFVVALNTVAPGAAPTGWTAVATGTANGYSMAVYEKDTTYTAGDAQPTVTATSGTGGVAWIEHYASDVGGNTVTRMASQVALDTTTGSTAFSATGSSVTSANNDWLVGCMGLKSSATMTANASSIVLSQASATLGTAVGQFGARLASASPTNSLYYNCYTRPVTTGASGAMSFTATGGAGAANVAGPALLMLLRETASATDYVKTQDDAEGITDAAASATDFARSPADPVGLTDAASQVAAADRVQGDPVGVTDSASQVAAMERSQGDAIGLTDSVIASFQLVATVDDAVGVTDTGAEQAVDFGENVPDPVGIADVAATLATTQRAPADPTGVTDTAAATSALQRGPADAAGITDAITAVMSKVVTVADFLALTDGTSTDFVGDGIVSTSDPEPISDAATWSATTPRSPADPLGLADTAVAVLERVFTPTPGDAVALSDGLITTLAQILAAPDPVGITDAVSALLGSEADIPVALIIATTLRTATVAAQLRTDTIHGGLR